MENEIVDWVEADAIESRLLEFHERLLRNQLKWVDVEKFEQYLASLVEANATA